MRQAALTLVVFFVAFSAAAADMGRADGALTIDQNQISLGYAYAVGHQKNETTMKGNEVRVVLTDKPLADTEDLTQVEATLPADMYAVIFNIGKGGKVTHIAVLHPKGSYDGGFLEDMPDFHFKDANGNRGTISGRISSGRVQTNTMQFSVDADFNAQVK